ncbi:endo-1,4-beta-xylanase, partial [bacterium]|nr:endo-1,4-beta-xylanase [bacterium]
MNFQALFVKSTSAFAISVLIAAQVALAAPPTGVAVISSAPDALAYFGPGDKAAMIRQVAVVGQDFPRALQIDTLSLATPVTGDYGLFANPISAVKKGDVLWVSFKARCLEARRESGEAAFELRLDQMVNGKYQWPAYIERGVSVGREWTEISIPYQMERDAGLLDLRLVLIFDQYLQRFEISPLTVINCGQNVKAADLPRSVMEYGGSEADAPWRKAAAGRIEKFRKGDLAVQVRDEAGKPVAKAEVKVRMKRLAFHLGTAVNSRTILDPTSPDAKQAREILTKYFNQIVFENEMKWPRWSSDSYQPDKTLLALDWTDAHGLTARGHVMVWPSWRHVPGKLKSLKDDKEALRREVLNHIARQTQAMKGRFTQWDVTNELFANHDLIDILGRDEVVEWYRAAHQGAPDAKLFYNEYTMFHPEGPGPDHFYDMVKFLKEQGAPLQGIGEQAHIGGSPPAIPLVLSRLEKFGALGYPITITEFDMANNDEDFQAAYL